LIHLLFMNMENKQREEYNLSIWSILSGILVKSYS